VSNVVQLRPTVPILLTAERACEVCGGGGPHRRPRLVRIRRIDQSEKDMRVFPCPFCSAIKPLGPVPTPA
jgi:hypothetical protein